MPYRRHTAATLIPLRCGVNRISRQRSFILITLIQERVSGMSRTQTVSDVSGPYTFHSGRWSCFQTATLALFSVGVNTYGRCCHTDCGYSCRAQSGWDWWVSADSGKFSRMGDTQQRTGSLQKPLMRFRHRQARRLLIVGVFMHSIPDRCAGHSPCHREVGNIPYDEGLRSHDRVLTDASPLQDSGL